MSSTASPEIRRGRVEFGTGVKEGAPRETGVFAGLMARRVGMAGLMYSACYLVFEIVFILTRWDQVRELRTFYLSNSAVGVVAGLALYWASRKWSEEPEFVLKLGLGFEVLASLQIGLTEAAMPFSDSLLIRGHSAIALWIGVFALLAPAPLGQALPAALASALMAPLGIWVHVLWHGHTSPPVQVWVLWSAAPMLMALAGTWLARGVYEMGKDLDAAREMGNYKLTEPLGQGGMGEVWKAKHRFLARDAAVKLIGERFVATEVRQKRFEREAKVIARLECPHTVSIFDFGMTPGGQLYYAMELIRGLNLDQMVKRFGPMPVERVMHVWMGVLRSLEEAHQAGLIHRDVKPSNILLARLGLEHDFVKVVDFGLVKGNDPGSQTQLTMEQTTVGTPAYMAPEMAEGDEMKVDGRADLYSLGCVVYFLLTGGPVFEGATPMAVILKHVQEPVMGLRERSELPVPDEMERLVMWCLEKNPAARPQSARELLDAICRMNAGEWDRAARRKWWELHLPEMA